MPRMKIIGSRRGKPLLPLWAQWPVFVASGLVTLFVLVAWARGGVDSYAHEHARMALLCGGLTLMAAAGLARSNRTLHVALFLGGGACVILSSILSLTA